MRRKDPFYTRRLSIRINVLRPFRAKLNGKFVLVPFGGNIGVRNIFTFYSMTFSIPFTFHYNPASSVQIMSTSLACLLKPMASFPSVERLVQPSKEGLSAREASCNVSTKYVA